MVRTLMEAIAKQIPATNKTFPKVSIIMPRRNEADTLAACIGNPKRSLNMHDFTNISTEDAGGALQSFQSLCSLLAPLQRSTIAVRPKSWAGSKLPPSTPDYQSKLSAVISAFNEEGNITVLRSRLTAIFEDTHIDYETIFVDDSSNDVNPKDLVETSAFQAGRSCPLLKTVNTNKLLTRRQLPKSLSVSRPARYPSPTAYLRKRFELIAKLITFLVFTSVGSLR
jgi:cellulose synthase/poly-beta-1,6-N-acetylglucosamine synthase-like glycosyltransferase